MVQSAVSMPNFEASLMERPNRSWGSTIGLVTSTSVEELHLYSQEHLQDYTCRRINE